MIDKKYIVEKIYKNKYFEVPPKFREKRVQDITALVLTLFALSFFGLLAINPTLSTIASLKKQLTDSEMVDKKLTEKITSLSILQQKYGFLGSSLPLIFSSLPEKPDAPRFVAQVRSLASDSGVNLARFQTFQVELLSPSQVLNEYQLFSFSLDAQGSYGNIKNFLSKLVSMDRVTTIDTLSINKTESLWILGLRGKTFFKKQVTNY